jgi:hypothetical protein
MSRVSIQKPIKGIEIKCSGRRMRTSNEFETHEALWKMRSMKYHDKSSICVPHYAWSGFGGVISTTFPHATLRLAPVLEGVSEITSTILDF